MTNLGTGACRSFVKSVWLGLNASCILRQVFWPFRSMCRKERRCQRTCLSSRVQSSRALLETFLHFAQRYYGRKTTLKLHKNKGTGSYLNCSQTGSVPAPFILWSWHLLHWQWTIGWWLVPCQEAWRWRRGQVARSWPGWGSPLLSLFYSSAIFSLNLWKPQREISCSVTVIFVVSGHS